MSSLISSLRVSKFDFADDFREDGAVNVMHPVNSFDIVSSSFFFSLCGAYWFKTFVRSSSIGLPDRGSIMSIASLPWNNLAGCSGMF